MTQALKDRSALTALFASGWEMVEGRDALHKNFKFKSFRSAWGWMSDRSAVFRPMKYWPGNATISNLAEADDAINNGALQGSGTVGVVNYADPQNGGGTGNFDGGDIDPFGLTAAADDDFAVVIAFRALANPPRFLTPSKHASVQPKKRAWQGSVAKEKVQAQKPGCQATDDQISRV